MKYFDNVITIWHEMQNKSFRQALLSIFEIAAERIRMLRFRHIRPKAASEIEDCMQVLSASLFSSLLIEKIDLS